MSRTPVARGNDHYVTASITLGDLVHVHSQPAWNGHEKNVVIRFQHGTVEIDNDTLMKLVQLAEPITRNLREEIMRKQL